MKAYIIEELVDDIWEDTDGPTYHDWEEALDDRMILDAKYPDSVFRVTEIELPDPDTTINFDAPDKHERYGVTKNQLLKD